MTARDVRHAALDLDGTLIDDDGRLLPGVGSGLDRLRDAGLDLVLVTGRSVALLAALDLELDRFHPKMLAGDGNAILDHTTGEATYRRALPAGVVAKLLEHGLTEMVADVDHRHVATSRRASTWFAMAHRLPRSEVAIDPTLDRGAGQVGSILLLDQREPPRLALGDEIDIQPYGRTNAILIRPRGTCKGAALVTYVAEAYGEDNLDAVIAIGDGRNDRCMLAMARVGVAVRDSHGDAVAQATMHLSMPIGEFLETFDPAALVRRDHPVIVDDCVH